VGRKKKKKTHPELKTTIKNKRAAYIQALNTVKTGHLLISNSLIKLYKKERKNDTAPRVSRRKCFSVT